jgi:hypothetical protein
MNRPALLLPAAILLLAGCGSASQNPSENAADQLEEAAGQSDPAAAEVLQNQADAVREGKASAQNAMQDAGNAQAATVQTPSAVPPSMQAQPNRTGQQVPPPKIHTGPGAGTGAGTGAGGNSH